MILKRLFSKKVGGVAFLVALFVAAIFVVPRLAEKTVFIDQRTAGKNELSQQLIALAARADDDRDGLQNWEETLWKTDPQNPDSDGDGTSDGDEVASGRNPVKAGPGDELSMPDPTKQASGSPQGTLTFSDRLGTQMFSEYMRYKQAGVPLSAETIESIVAPVIGTVQGIAPDTPFTAADFTVTDNSTMSLRSYANAMGAIIIDHSPQNFENELVILERAVSTENFSELEKIKKNATSYRALVKKATIVPVPRDMLILHTTFMNSVSALAGVASDLGSLETDPLRTLAGVEAYLSVAPATIVAAHNIQLYFEKNNVSFSPREPGAVFASLR